MAGNAAIVRMRIFTGRVNAAIVQMRISLSLEIRDAAKAVTPTNRFVGPGASLTAGSESFARVPRGRLRDYSQPTL